MKWIRGRTLCVMLLMCLVLGMELCGTCYAVHGGGGGESSNYSPDMDPGDNQTAALGYSYATLGLTIVKSIAAIVVLWGILEFGTSIYHHDPSVRMQGTLHVVTGVLLYLVGKIIKEWGIF